MSEPITVDLDQPRNLTLTLKGAKALDRACGQIGLFTVNRNLGAFNIETLERVLWACMLEDEPTLTLALTAKRVETYQKKNKTLAPLFVAAAEALDASGLFNPLTEEPSGNGMAATA